MKVRLISLLACASLVVAAPVLAHHSFSGEYDSTKPVTLTGKVTKVEWTNPHARFYIDVKGDDGQTTNWNLELASPNVLKRQGWSSSSLKEGDVVTVEGSLARSGAKMANARVVTLADGSRVFARAAADGGA
jgi:uncharacterized protein DUF6152